MKNDKLSKIYMAAADLVEVVTRHVESKGLSVEDMPAVLSVASAGACKAGRFPHQIFSESLKLHLPRWSVLDDGILIFNPDVNLEGVEDGFSN